MRFSNIGYGIEHQVFGEDLHKPSNVTVLLSNKYFHITWNYFQHGYRNTGIVYYKLAKALSLYFGTWTLSISFR